MITEQRERWLAAGSPPVPTLVLDGVAHVLVHPGQAPALLGVGMPLELRDAEQVASDVDELVEAWIVLAATTPWTVLTAPGVVAGRTPLALVVDALHGVAALTGAIWTGWFHWPGNPETGETGDAAIGPYEASVIAAIRDRSDLHAFAERVALGWRAALREHELDPAERVRSPRGELALVELLEAQRLHCAGHYRQATASLGVAATLDLATLTGLVVAEALV